eukprot:6337949-Prymnesium_polylepis.1
MPPDPFPGAVSWYPRCMSRDGLAGRAAIHSFTIKLPFSAPPPIACGSLTMLAVTCIASPPPLLAPCRGGARPRAGGWK